MEYSGGSEPSVLEVWEFESPYPDCDITEGGIVMPAINMKATGNNIQQMRKQAGISVNEIQTACGLTTGNAVYKWINGICMPTIDNLVVIADLLGTTIDKIVAVNR